MAKKSTKPVKPAPKSGAKKPVKAPAAAKSKNNPAAAKSKSSPAKKPAPKAPAPNLGKPLAKKSSKAAVARMPAAKATPPPQVKKTPPESAKKAPVESKTKPATAKPAPAASAKSAAPKNGSPSKSKTTAAKPSPSQVVTPPPPVRKSVNPDDLAEVVIPKKSPFSPSFLKKQKQRLLDLRSSLYDAMEGVAKDSLRVRPEGSDASVGGMHMGDAGSDAYDRDFALSLLSKEQDALYEINEALKRIDIGSYGICEMTSKPINEERLEALPFARYTREAMESIERDQLGGRNRRVPVRSVFGLDEDENEDDDDEEEGSTTAKSSTSESSLDFMKE